MGDIHIRIDEEPIIIRMEPASIYPIPFTSLTDAPTTYHDQANKFVKVKAAEDGLEFVVAAGLTDELVKYDAGDTVPGYLADKIIAGTGISLSEGTGVDENKLKITGTASYTLPIATASILGGVKEGSGVTIGVDGTISAAGTYTLPIATGAALGGIKIGDRLTIDPITGILDADVQGGAGDVTGPPTNSADYIPQWNGANTKTLKDGLVVPDGGLAGLTALGLKLDSSAFSDAGVTGKLITGFSSGAGTVEATDTILQALNKLNGNIAAKEVPLTFGSGVTRSIANAVSNDLITGKSGGQTILGSTLASENLILSSTSHATIGSVNVGTIAKGENLNIQATEGAELAPALTGNSGVNWTLSNTTGYTQPFAGTIDKTGNGTGTITTTAATTIVAGTTYKVVIVISAISGSTATYTLGGVSGTALAAATTYTDYITASTTGKIIITPVATGLRITITSISIKALTDVTGDLSVYGNLKAGSPIQSINGINAIYINPSGRISLGGSYSDALLTINAGASTNVGMNLYGSNYPSINVGTASDNYGQLRFNQSSNWLELNTYAFQNAIHIIGNSQYFKPSGTEMMRVVAAGVSIGAIAPTALLHFKASTATAGTAATKWTPATSVLLTTPEIGAFEPVTDDISYTISTGTARKQLVMTDGTLLTSGRIPFAYTNGRLIDSSTLTYSASTGLATTLPITLSTASSGIVLKQGANGKCGTFTANGITPVTVSNTSIAITDCIIISLNTVGGTVGMQPTVATITAATGFTVVCTAGDTSIYNYSIISNAS